MDRVKVAVGDLFRCGSDVYVLALVGPVGSGLGLCLISLKTGNRYSDPVVFPRTGSTIPWSDAVGVDEFQWRALTCADESSFVRIPAERRKITITYEPQTETVEIGRG